MMLNLRMRCLGLYLMLICRRLKPGAFNERMETCSCDMGKRPKWASRPAEQRDTVALQQSVSYPGSVSARHSHLNSQSESQACLVHHTIML